MEVAKAALWELMKTLDSYFWYSENRSNEIISLWFGNIIKKWIDKFNDHPSFLKRAKSVTPDYYAEFFDWDN